MLTAAVCDDAVACLERCGIGAPLALTAWYEHAAQCVLRREVAPAFWRQFRAPVTDSVSVTATAFDALHARFARFLPQITRLAALVAPSGGDSEYRTELSARLQLLLKAIVFAGGGGGRGRYFSDALYQFYFQAFRAFDASGVNEGKRTVEVTSLFTSANQDWVHDFQLIPIPLQFLNA